MPRSTQPTVTMHSTRAGALWLHPGITVQDRVRGRRYRVTRLLGEGGFGAVYQAQAIAADGGAATCVLKVTRDAAAWHREAYFGHILRHVPALVEVHDSFAWMPRDGAAPLYCLVSEYLEEGDLHGYLERHPEAWGEARARREIVRLLRAVTTLHQSGAVHRDITPRNVFVTGKGTLKLGDFGIALHRQGRKEVAADAFAPRFAPAAIQLGARHWRQADDVHQVGQLLAALLAGNASRKFTSREVKQLACSARTKSVLQRSIGPRRRCFADAAGMLEALTQVEAPVRASRVSTLKGKRLVFTGALSIPRAAARRLARKAGATVERQVNRTTDIVVVGGRSPHWKAGEKGQKLLDVDHEAERGHYIARVKEARFLTLAGYSTRK